VSYGDPRMPAPLLDASAPSPLLPLLDGTSATLAQLHDLLGRLGERLAPVLPPASPQLVEAAQTAINHHASHGRVVGQVLGLGDGLREACDRVQGLLDRLEV
jgi:hypothetical protein